MTVAPLASVKTTPGESMMGPTLLDTAAGAANHNRVAVATRHTFESEVSGSSISGSSGRRGWRP